MWRKFVSMAVFFCAFALVITPMPAYAQNLSTTITISIDFINEIDNSPVVNPTDDNGDSLASVSVNIVDATTQTIENTVTLTPPQWRTSYTVAYPDHTYTLSYALPAQYRTADAATTHTQAEPDIKNLTIAKSPSIAAEENDATGQNFLIGTGAGGTSGLVIAPGTLDTAVNSLDYGALQFLTSPEIEEVISSAYHNGSITMSTSNGDDVDALIDALEPALWNATYIGTKNDERHYEFSNNGQFLSQVYMFTSSRKSMVGATNDSYPEAVKSGVSVLKHCPNGASSDPTSAFSWNGTQAWFSYNIKKSGSINCGRNVLGNTTTPVLASQVGEVTGDSQIMLYTYEFDVILSPDWTTTTDYTITATRIFNPPATASHVHILNAPLMLMLFLSFTALMAIYAWRLTKKTR